jgi:hypothetical protein
MQRLLSGDLWTEIGKAAKVRPIRAAIAYVSTAHPLNLGKGDLLIVNASDHAIAAGETSAKVLRMAFKRGATLRSRPDLHAKVLLCGDTAIVGSANVSESSKNLLTEVAVLTDRADIVSPVRAFLNNLATVGSDHIDEAFLRRISAIKVTRRGRAFGRRKHKRPRLLESQSWMAVLGLDDSREAHFEQLVKSGLDAARVLRSDKKSSIDYFWWRGSSLLTTRAKRGDRVVRVYADVKKKTFSKVEPPATVLVRRKRESRTYFFVEVPSRIPHKSVTKARLMKWLAEAGFKRRIGVSTATRLPPRVAEALDLKWRTRT